MDDIEITDSDFEDIDEDEDCCPDFDLDFDCIQCQGTGEGCADGVVCEACKGSGSQQF